MKTKITIFAVFLLSLTTVKAQVGDRELDVRLGLGVIGFEKNDYSALIDELEIASELNRHFSLASSIVSSCYQQNYDYEFYSHEPLFLQLNLNAFASPFGNDRRFDFRIGAGPSYYHFFSNDSDYNGHNGLGFSLATESSYVIKRDAFLGLKIFRQKYLNNHVFWGVLLKIGAKI